MDRLETCTSALRRRDLLKLGAAALASSLPSASFAAGVGVGDQTHRPIEQWGMFECSLQGPASGNPYKEVVLRATFSQAHRTVEVSGFYDGEGTYRVRFMPDQPGPWTYRTRCNTTRELDGRTGAFLCTPAGPANHGPITTAHQFHFQHADGTSYFPFGTTTYAALFAEEEDFAHCLEGLQAARFNKSRVCILPKSLGRRPGQPEQILPFPRTGSGASAANDLTRFNPAYFQLLERRLLALQQAGVEADCILFHPYDSWGYKAMGAEADDFYLRYAIARLSAFRNVWWAIANEYDLVKSKTTADWDRFFRITQAEDPYSHLRSIHHSRVIYDHSKPWCTHASLQLYDFEKSAARRAAWNKPIVYDEIQYEGDVDRRWGNLAAEEMTRRFWLAIVNGVYASHGEVFASTDDDPHGHQPTWSDCGRLRGESGSRIAFLRTLLERSTHSGLNQLEGAYYLNAADVGPLGGTAILYYFDIHRPARYDFPLPADGSFSATLIDPYGMTTKDLPGTFTGKSRIPLASRPYQAVLFRKTGSVKPKVNTPGNEPQVPLNEPG